jgi:nucleotide-binding universal stress UspA family protein
MNTVPARVHQERPEIVVRPALAAITRVVVGVDGSAAAAAALRWAVAEACRRQASLRIVSAWQEPGQSRYRPLADPARRAAAHVQDALAAVLAAQRYPARIACLALKGAAGEVLLAAADPAGLLVLGITRGGTAGGGVPVAGQVNRCCLRHGRGPLVFVPA